MDMSMRILADFEGNLIILGRFSSSVHRVTGAPLSGMWYLE